MNRENYFTIGEFAEICNVEKSLLNYYDKMGIISPSFLDSNGYRYYSLEQIPELTAILNLKHKGMQLKDIRQYMDTRSPEALVLLLSELSDNLSDRIEVLLKEKRELDTMRSIAEEGVLNPKGIVIEKDLREEYYVTTPYHGGQSDRNWYLTKISHLHYVSSLGPGTSTFSGTLKETYGDQIDDAYAISYFQSRVVGPDVSDHVHIKKAGHYLVLYHNSGYSGSPAFHRAILDYAEKQGLQLGKYIFGDVIFNEMAEFGNANHTIRLSVRVL